MSGTVTFLTHAEVVIDPDVAITDWGLNAVGHARHASFARDPVLSAVTSIHTSEEQKAIDGAAHVAKATGLVAQQHPGLGENDRSATGFLPPDEFWPVVAQFFAAPDTSVRGWETARAAQTRIVTSVRDVLHAAPAGDLLIVSHGGVATLLRCHLLRCDITQSEGGPHPGGGNWFAFDRDMTQPPSAWRTI